LITLKAVLSTGSQLLSCALLFMPVVSTCWGRRLTRCHLM
jgi:hypothetical protein